MTGSAGNKVIAMVLAALSILTVLGTVESLFAGELVGNGDFESGDFPPYWTHGAGDLWGRFNSSWADHLVTLDMPYGGNYSALLGFKYTTQRRNRFAFMYQDVTIPSNISRATLYFRFRQQGYDGSGYDPFRMEIRDLQNNILETVVNYSFNEWNNEFKDTGWISDDGVGPEGHDMTSYAGMTVRLYFRQSNLWDNLYETWVYVDDVSLVYRRFVDLAVDGDGDDLFGEIGTGDGGFSAHSTQAGDSVKYALDIENEGVDTDSYQLNMNLPSGWSAVVRYGGIDYPVPWTTPAVPPGSTINAQVILVVPAGEAVGGYTTIVDAVSTSYSNRYDSIRLQTNVLPTNYGVDLVVDSDGLGVVDPSGDGGSSLKEAAPDTELTYSLELYNTGDAHDSFLVWFDAAQSLTLSIEEGASVHTAPFVVSDVPQGAVVNMVLHVVVPAGVLGGDYVSLVHARSVSDTLREDCIKAITRVRAPKVDMVISGSGDGIIDGTGSGLGGSSTISGTRGGVVYFPVSIQNEGAIADSFALDWQSPGNGWSAVINDGVSDHAFPWTTARFEPLSEKTYYLAVSIPGNAAYGTYSSILDAVSTTDGNARESVSAIVSVSSGNETDLIIDGNGDDIYGPLGTGLGGGSSVYCDPGDTVYLSIRVENEGGEDLFDIRWSAPQGWYVAIGDSTSSMLGVGSGTYTMMVCVPQACAGGTFELVVDGSKTNKPYFVDSVKGTIVVSTVYIVDALIDGDGEDSFGAPGTGSGGSSYRVSARGGHVVFDIELKNKGGGAESYKLSWNAIPGWSAVIGGAPSPYTTGTVNPGESLHIDFDVTSAPDAAEGDYTYTIDVVSTQDSSNVESITATIHINPPPEVDLVIEGDGAATTAPWGSGDGGRAVVHADPGSSVTAQLEVFNTGGVTDSFYIRWSVPEGWSAGSILVSDGLTDYTSPYVTDTIAAGASVALTVKISVPSDAQGTDYIIIDGKPLSNDSFDSVKLEIGTSAYIVVTVFDDSDHDSSKDAGEDGMSDVQVIYESAGDQGELLTGAAGSLIFPVTHASIYDVIEVTPGGYISLSSDTVSVVAPSAGDTVTVYFADVRTSDIITENSVSAPAGGVIDLPHTIVAGTRGQADLVAQVPPGWIQVYYRDNNSNGVLDSADTRLAGTDLYLDPDVPGRDVVPVIMRVYIPSTVAAGSVWSLRLKLEQTLEGTSIVTGDFVTDAVAVLARATGLLRLTKDVDMGQVRPGDMITYTITFSNPGTEPVREIVIIDPVSDAVEIVTDAFGPGRDIEWTRDGVAVYLTADPSDSDEAMYLSASRQLKVLLSRQSEYILQSGAVGRIVYRVRVK